MIYVRTIALLMCVAAVSSQVSAKPSAAQMKKAAAECDAVFDQALDNCLGGGWGPTECLESAAASRAQCMRRHGVDVPYPTRKDPSSPIRPNLPNVRREHTPTKSIPGNKSPVPLATITPTSNKSKSESSTPNPGAVPGAKAPASIPSKARSTNPAR